MLLKIIFLCGLSLSLYSCNDPAKGTSQLNDRITRLEHRIDSLEGKTQNDSFSQTSLKTFIKNERCQAITKKGTQCKRKGKYNGFCMQHRK
jgi:hypothetical protein